MLWKILFVYYAYSAKPVEQILIISTEKYSQRGRSLKESQIGHLQYLSNGEIQKYPCSPTQNGLSRWGLGNYA